MKLIIGCPVKNDLEVLKLMVDSLYNSTNIDYTLAFVVGENCNQETIDYLENLPFKKGVAVIIIKYGTKTPLEAYNALFDYAKTYESDLLLTQTDVIFPKLYNRDWLKEMQTVASNKEIGAVTCLNGYGIAGGDHIKGLAWLGAWCTYFPFRTIEQIGGYDENFPEGHYGVDIDHTYRIAQAKLRIEVINYWVDHHMANSREHDRHPDTEKHKLECARYFRKKWRLGE